MGIVYHANYLVWCEIGRVEHMRALGYRYADLERSGVHLAVSDATLRYLSPARYDDPIRVVTHLRDVRSRRLSFDYSISHAEKHDRLVEVSTTLVSLDASGRVATLPAAIRQALLIGVD